MTRRSTADNQLHVPHFYMRSTRSPPTRLFQKELQVSSALSTSLTQVNVFFSFISSWTLHVLLTTTTTGCHVTIIRTLTRRNRAHIVLVKIESSDSIIVDCQKNWRVKFSSLVFSKRWIRPCLLVVFLMLRHSPSHFQSQSVDSLIGALLADAVGLALWDSMLYLPCTWHVNDYRTDSVFRDTTSNCVNNTLVYVQMHGQHHRTLCPAATAGQLTSRTLFIWRVILQMLRYSTQQTALHLSFTDQTSRYN